MEYTREKLIEICERAIVNIDAWNSEDSFVSQTQLGACWALLKSGCEFKVKDTPAWKGDFCVTNAKIIWLSFYVKDSEWFEICGENDPLNESDIYFLPTEQQLNRFRNEDWY